MQSHRDHYGHHYYEFHVYIVQICFGKYKIQMVSKYMYGIYVYPKRDLYNVSEHVMYLLKNDFIKFQQPNFSVGCTARGAYLTNLCPDVCVKDSETDPF